VLVIHGIESWSPARGAATRMGLGMVDFVISVSDLTRERFASWSKIPERRTAILPNCIDVSAYGIRPKDEGLTARLALDGGPVILTLGRLDSRERYKGHDEVLDALPALARDFPRLKYLVAGDGDDIPRLQRRARELGIGEHVVFAGFIDESQKAAVYSVADAFVMPGRGEGFGIVYLEAMASGLPVIGSVADGSREALRGGTLGFLVDPADRTQLVSAIREALRRPKSVPKDLDFFDTRNFVKRCHAIIESVYAG
jgi:glycosyltransferase involved in cell wall biosynthesis